MGGYRGTMGGYLLDPTFTENSAPAFVQFTYVQVWACTFRECFVTLQLGSWPRMYVTPLL